MSLAARCLADRPAEVARFLATAAGRSFSTGEAFERALDLHDPPRDRRCFVVSEGDRLVAALPGRLERRFGGAWFRAQPHGTPAGPLFASDSDDALRASAASVLWPALEQAAREEGWLGGDVTLYGPAGASRALWPGGALGTMREDEAHVIDLTGGVEAWRASLSNASRRMIGQAARRGVSFEVGGAAELDATYALFLAQARRWGLSRVRPLSFYRALLEPGGARLWVARLSGRVVCGVLAFVSPEETYLWWSGSSPDARPVRAYPATIARIVEECGSARVNLGFSGRQARLTDFKEGLGARPIAVPIVELAARARTPWHALLAAARDGVRRRRLHGSPA
jgi:hypothetical protein